MICGKRSFFHEIFLNFILLLCVPLVTILFIFTQADKTVKTQVLESASKTFTLYYEQMSEVMVDMRNTCTTIFANEKCRLYSRESIGDSGMEDVLNYDIYQILQNLCKVEYYDIFVYYYRNNKIISGVYTTFTAEDYYDSYYGKVGQEGYRDEFLEVIKTDAKRPTCNVIQNINGDPYLCMTLGVRSNKLPDSNYTICIVLKPEYIEQMHIMQDIKEDSMFMIYNEADQSILSNDTNVKFDTIDAQEYILSADVTCDEWVDKGKYMIQVKETDKPDNKYVYIVFSDYFWDVLRNLRILSILGIFICMIVSIVFAYRSAVRAYNPIGNIIDLIQRTNDSTFDKKKQSELPYIMSFVKNNEKYLKESKKANREWCLSKLLDGKITPSESGVLEKNGISFPYLNLWVCILQLEMVAAEREDDLISFVVQNVMEELGNTIGKAYFVEVTKTRYALFVNTDREVSELHTMLNEGQSFLKQYCQMIMTMGCSNVYTEYYKIPEAYKEAQEAIRYRFLLGSGRLIYYNDIQERTFREQNKSENKIFMLMLDYIEGENENCDIEQFVERLMYIYEINEEISMEVADFFRKEVIQTLSNIMALHHYSKDACAKVVKELLALNTLTELQQHLGHYILELCKGKTCKKSKEDICVKVKNYIEANYNDTQLSVSMLGKEMGMQAAHLSKLFKETYGVSLLDHIASVRIAHAKRIFREEKWSVQKVAEMTGFIDSHAFIRIFKKLEGITPGKYKDLCEKE